MSSNPSTYSNPIGNVHGGAVGIVIALVLVLGVASGGGYWAYDKHFKQEPPRTKLVSLKVKEELVQFVHDRVSRAMHHNIIAIDDIVVMMDREMKRLKGIGKKFPDQRGIVAPQVKALSEARQRLAGALKKTTGAIEKIYVTWLVDRSEGIGLIKAQKGTLTRSLADAIRGEQVLISRIRNNPSTTS